MNKDIVELKEDISQSDLYSKDLAPVPPEKRTWNTWHLAAIWVGMAVCIPTYLLASYMIMDGLGWLEALVIIGLANLIITVPMVLNGHAGVKYGIPFPVIGRSSFGILGIHIPSLLRAVVACGWFGIQTWIGGLAIYAIWNALTGNADPGGLTAGKFAGFAIFWCINIYFIWKGTESIKFLEQYSAPILILMGLLLIGWGAGKAGGFGIVLKQSQQLATPTAQLETAGGKQLLTLNPIRDKSGNIKASQYQLTIDGAQGDWLPLGGTQISLPKNGKEVKVRFRKGDAVSSEVLATPKAESKAGLGGKLWKYLLWLTGMVGFWATMSLSIADITRYASTQREQVMGQFIGLPGTMMLYSFVGIFVTCAAIINFDDILVGADAPWDPVSLVAKFSNPVVVVVAQLFMLVATLSTNIAANVIAPANAFSNLYPKGVSFRLGGLIAGVIGILICPWLLMDEIAGILIFVSGLLGPVLGIMLADYYLVRNKEVQLAELYKTKGAYTYAGGFNPAAIISLAVGMLAAIAGFYIPALGLLYKLSWFTGFFVSFGLYWLLMRGK